MSDGEKKNNKSLCHWQQQRNCHRQNEVDTNNLTFDLLCQHQHQHQQQLDTQLKQRDEEDNTIRQQNWRENQHINNCLKLKCACSERLGDTDWMAKINVRTAEVSIISHQRQARSFFYSLSPFTLCLSRFIRCCCCCCCCWVSLHIFPLLLFLMFLLVHIFTSSFQSAKWFNGCISVRSDGSLVCVSVCLRRMSNVDITRAHNVWFNITHVHISYTTSSQAYISIRFVLILCINDVAVCIVH